MSARPDAPESRPAPRARVVLATGNPGKLRELRALLGVLGMDVSSQSEFDVPPVEETGESFVENALIKARAAARASGLPAIADDSGLVVDALGGAPGIHSARYAGAGASDEQNLRKLLRDMERVPPAGRGGRFVCVMVYLDRAADPMPLIAEGVWEGRILAAPRGGNGFGYDPVFLVPGEGRSSAELDPARKNALSHRGLAARRLVERLTGR